MNNKNINVEMNSITERLFESLKRHPKRIVFTEGEDVRILKAAARLVELEIIAPIVLGNKDRIKKLAFENDVSLKFVNVLNPKTASDLPLFISRLEKIERFKGKLILNPEDLISKPHNFAAMMVQYGQADGIISGNQSLPATIHRSLLQFIKPLDRKCKLFTCVLMTAPHLKHFGREGMLFLADCGVIPKPSVEELAHIAVETGKLAEHLIGRTPRVALLSHSTHGSMPSKSSERMAAATALARDIVKREYLDIQIDGELQADVALDMAAAEQKFTDAQAANSADVLVFPNLDSSHISYKILQHVGGADCYGQLIMGLTRNAAQIPKTASVNMIVGTAALVGCESIKSRELYPDRDIF